MIRCQEKGFRRNAPEALVFCRGNPRPNRGDAGGGQRRGEAGEKQRRTGGAEGFDVNGAENQCVSRLPRLPVFLWQVFVDKEAPAGHSFA
jgi:hypothetical protein